MGLSRKGLHCGYPASSGWHGAIIAAPEEAANTREGGNCLQAMQ